jgi:hypothetical protein
MAQSGCPRPSKAHSVVGSMVEKWPVANWQASIANLKVVDVTVKAA